MSILLRNGVALIHDASNHVVPTKTSILIEHGKIAKIAEDIPAHDGIEVIDCTDKVISPGFIDTHRHGWQTQLKGRHADEQLIRYMVTGKSHKGSCLHQLNHPRQLTVISILSRRCLLWPVGRHVGKCCSWYNHGS